MYYLVISVFAWIKRDEEDPHNFPVENKFAVLICAHNEEAVVANLIENLKKIDYPDDMYDIYVIADNCTDNTAQIARDAGAIACERFDDKERGKGFALKWMFAKIVEMGDKYDAICVLDADNLVSNNFLMEMNKHLCKGEKCIQGYIDCKNPYDTWIAGNNSIAFWISNRLIQLPRYYIGLSCLLCGTGFVITTDILKNIGWEAVSLTEDLEFSLKLIVAGEKTSWAHDAVIYDEKPLKLKQSYKQRKRWMQGHFDCAGRFLIPLLKRAFTKRSFPAFDVVLYLVQPAIVVVNGIGIIYTMISIFMNMFNNEFDTTSILYAFILLSLLYVSSMFIVLEGKFNLRMAGYLLLLPFYNLTWVPIIIHGFIDRKKKHWVHTLHTRSISIEELMNEVK